MYLRSDSREFYTLEIETEPAVAGWEMSVDGVEWHPGEQDGTNPNIYRWLLAGSEAEPGEAVEVISATKTEVLIRAISDPEIIIRSAPSVRLVTG